MIEGERGIDRPGTPVGNEVDTDLYEPAPWRILALLLVAGAAVALAVLPAAAGLGASPRQLGGLAVGIMSLAASIGVVLGGVKPAAVAIEIGRRLVARHPAKTVATLTG